MIKRLLAVSLFVSCHYPIASNAQSVLLWQGDTVFHSVVGRLTHAGSGYQNASWSKTLRIKDAYFVHQSDSIFVCITTFDWTNFDIPGGGFSGVDFKFRAPKIATTTYDTLVMVCCYTNDTGNRRCI